jgi:hypothetical protein
LIQGILSARNGLKAGKFCPLGRFVTTYYVQVLSGEVGTRNFFLSLQSQCRNLKEALTQLQFRNFLKKCCSAIPQSQFFLMSATSSPQLESFISAIFGIFLAVESGRGS